MPVAGGATTAITDAGTGRGAAWDANGDIIFQSSLFPQSPLVRVTAAGARTDRGTTLAPGEMTHRWPQILPNGKLLYSGHSDVSAWDAGTVRVETGPGTPGKIVWKGGYHGRYVPSGHLLYIHSGTLYGMRFDLDRLEATSPPVPIVENVVATASSGGAHYSGQPAEVATTRPKRPPARPATAPRIVVPWPVPADDEAPEPVVVPKVAGLSVRAAAAALHRRGFEVAVAGSGTVSGSDPAAGTRAKVGTIVRLEVE